MLKKCFLVISLMLLFISCSSEKYGILSDGAPEIKVKEAILNESYLNKEVKIKGTIAIQCLSSGCWFFLKDDTGQILVDLKPLNLGLPQRSGKKATVSGIVTKESSGQIVISARGLSIN